MKIQDARELGDQLADLVSFQRYEEACDLLSPLLAERTPFRLLDAIGGRLGIEPLDAVNVFLDQVAAQRAMGGWVIIASTLRQQLIRDLPGTFEPSYIFCHRCRCLVCHRYIWRARPWPGAGIAFRTFITLAGALAR